MLWMEKAQTTTNKLHGYVSASGQPQVAWRTAVWVSYRRFTDKEACERITDFTYLSFMVDGYRDVSTSDCEDARTKGRDSDWCVHMTASKNLSYFVAQSVVISLKFSVIWVIIHWEQAYFMLKPFQTLTENRKETESGQCNNRSQTGCDNLSPDVNVLGVTATLRYLTHQT